MCKMSIVGRRKRQFIGLHGIPGGWGVTTIQLLPLRFCLCWILMNGIVEHGRVVLMCQLRSWDGLNVSSRELGKRHSTPQSWPVLASKQLSKLFGGIDKAQRHIDCVPHGRKLSLLWPSIVVSGG